MYRTVREEVTIQIRNKILKGEIGQGDRIKEADLAEELGTSRGPIREAFRELEQEGLITYASRKGCSVRIISSKDAHELYLLRATLENLAIECCNANYSEVSLKKMDNIISEMDKCSLNDDLLKIIDCDQRFHEIIVKEAGMQRIHEMWSSLDSANAVVYYALYKTRYAPKGRLAGNHKLILDALKTHDINEVKKVLSSHYLIVSENLQKTEENRG